MNRKSDTSHVTLYAFLACFFLLISFVMLYEPNLNLPKITQSNNADFMFEAVIVSHIFDGELKWELESRYAEIDKVRDRIMMEDAEGGIFGDGARIVKFKAPETYIKLGDSNMELKKAVAQFFYNEKVVFLKSHVLHWLSEKKQFVGKKSVEVKSDGFVLKGRHLFVDVESKKMVVTDHAKATVKGMY
jgi:hypothetical protein